MAVIEVIHTDGLSDIINPAHIEGIAESKLSGNTEVHYFTVYSHSTKWKVSDCDVIMFTELNACFQSCESVIKFENFKEKIKKIILMNQGSED